MKRYINTYILKQYQKLDGLKLHVFFKKTTPDFILNPESRGTLHTYM